MSKPNKYKEQISHAVETVRQDLLTRLKDAQAARNTALVARDLAAHDQWTAYKQMGSNEQVLAVSTRIEEQAARTQLLARNLTLFANDSQSSAEAVQSAMADAAAAIKNASGAMEALNMEIHGVAAVTKTQNKGNEIEANALAANHAVKHSMEGVDALQSQSLQSSITAATPLAGSVAQAFSVLNDQIATLVTDTTQARDTARQEVAAMTSNRSLTWKRFSTTIPPLERRRLEKQSLLTSLQEIDQLANFGLAVCISNLSPAQGSVPSPDLDQAGLLAGLHVKVTLPKDTDQLYKAPRFYAVEEAEAATFKFPKERLDVSAEETATGEGITPRPAGTVFSATLQTDHRGAPIIFGRTYRVFMQQALKDPDAPRKHETGPRLSLPSQPIVASYSSQKLSAPQILRLPCGASPGPCDPLLVAFTLPGPPPAGVRYRMILIPGKLWEKQQADEEFLLERTSPADYAALDFSPMSPGISEVNDLSNIAAQISARFAADIKVLLPTGDHAAASQAAATAITARLEQIGREQIARTALVYYSPVNSVTVSAQGKHQAGRPAFTFGYYSDMSGDIINLSNDYYKVAVLAAPASPTVSNVGALVGESRHVGAHTPHYYGSGPVEPTATPADTPATTTTPASSAA